MLPKNLRIKIGEFNRNPQKFEKFYASSFNLFIKMPDKSGGLAIAVPKSLDKRSSRRNFTRRVFEQIILHLGDSIKMNKQILIRAKTIISAGNRRAVEEEFRKLVSRVCSQ